jgi:hypothetical protein
MQPKNTFHESPKVFSELTSEHVTAGINWFSKMNDAARWNLSNAEASELLGGIGVSKYLSLKRKAAENLPLKVSQDLCERISLLLGIWESLQNIAPVDRKDLAYQWFTQPSTSQVLEGKSIKQYLLDCQSMEALYVVNRHLKSLSI